MTGGTDGPDEGSGGDGSDGSSGSDARSLPPEVPLVAGGRHEARERADLVRGVHDHRADLDEVIARLARGWSIDRMPSIDLEVLRVACFELAHRPDVPTGVILSEAVELAGRYGTDDSSRFVNGVLSSAAAELRPDA